MLLPEHGLPAAAALGPRGRRPADVPRMKLQTQRRRVITRMRDLPPLPLDASILSRGLPSAYRKSSAVLEEGNGPELVPSLPREYYCYGPGDYKRNDGEICN